MKRKNIGLISVIAATALVFTFVIVFVFAKYVQKDTLTGTANISAKLGNIELLESKAIKNDDGSYTLDVNDPVTSNEYSVVLPGYDIPKDPYVKITNKSSIPAYVYVEVVDTNLEAAKITYEIASNWKLIEGVTGQNGGDLYVYVTSVVNDENRIEILKENKIIVSQKLDKNATDLNLSFYAYMAETASGADAKAAYQNTFATP
ncbi:MAG: hypothetical protein IKU19_05805 [Clostridia bacterium]|nr:hypothetical protein [Clostridia bacterium]